ncbi:cytochrome b [Ciceribacter sp. L1K23]|uniref:cytochrome b n=1 Tax=Ciceribacter sp. L1K23 TaxID=2820276 RepID=UPI001B835344|nr:cytochrome b [Ciceribacter sp. L1K23]MBR0558319.1 cytochrome b [Ciceribacter sp. L1K23]
MTDNLSLSGVVSPTDAVISVQRYPATSRILHWIVAALVLATWPLGFFIQFTKQEVTLDFYMIHESFGFLALWLMLLRVGNKLIARPPHPEGPAVERIAAATVHGLLYAFLIIMPVSGFLATNAHGFPLVWFGLLPVWSPIGKTPDIAWTLSAIHAWSAWILLLLFALHIGAVLLHHVIKRDNTLYRIL